MIVEIVTEGMSDSVEQVIESMFPEHATGEKPLYFALKYKGEFHHNGVRDVRNPAVYLVSDEPLTSGVIEAYVKKNWNWDDDDGRGDEGQV